MSILTMHHGLMAGIKQGDPPGYVTIGGRLYRTVTIGTQTWLAENLDYKASGITIAAEGAPTTPAAWYYDNDEATYGEQGNKYGLLYNWYAVKFLNDNRATLFPGWHVPSEVELIELTTAVGGESAAGTPLKSKTGWSSGAGTDDYGFSIYPTGWRNRFSGFQDVGSTSSIMSSSLSSDLGVVLSFDTSGAAHRYAYHKAQSYSIRLVKDA